MSESSMMWMIGSAAAIVVVGISTSHPVTSMVTPRVETTAVTFAERSCDGATSARSDTTVDAQDPILRSLLGAHVDRTPRYPVELRNAGVSGVVIMSFVVDTLGLVPRGGATIHQETRSEFGDAVCANIMSARFSPLVANGKRMSVRVVNVPTTFEVRH